MKELRRVTFKWQLNPYICLPFREATFYTCAATLWESQSHFQVCDCVWMCLNVCVWVSSPQSPWQWCPIQLGTCRDKRWWGSVQSLCQAEEKKHQNSCRALARCWCTEKNQSSEDHSAPFTLWNHLGCRSQGKTKVTMATRASGDKFVHLCQLKNTANDKKHIAGIHPKHNLMCSVVQWFSKFPSIPGII